MLGLMEPISLATYLLFFMVSLVAICMAFAAGKANEQRETIRMLRKDLAACRELLTKPCNRCRAEMELDCSLCRDREEEAKRLSLN